MPIEYKFGKMYSLTKGLKNMLTAKYKCWRNVEYGFRKILIEYRFGKDVL